ncbi:hypothetical protein, partial [Okeania sp. SIO2B9]|uniref:hypothetical protein n=1 Tax=Okeania sp. SIO2B9 TaxID=2607782 RepID=UPI002580BC80
MVSIERFFDNWKDIFSMDTDLTFLPYIAVTTNLAAAAGLVSSLVMAKIRFNTPDLSFGINGVLGGLV